MPNDIRVLSLDFDGSLCHGAFAEGVTEDICAQNALLIQSLRAQPRFAEDIVFVGSNRNAYYDDCTNAWKLVVSDNQPAKSRSCYPHIQAIAKTLDARFNPMLMADVYNDLPFGTSLERALASDYLKASEAGHANWLFDPSKSTLIYAQMHHVATESPNNHIDFQFYDDCESILSDIATYFQKFPHLIPAHVTLKLYRYDGRSLELHTEIQGIGVIDRDFRTTVKRMADVAIQRDERVAYRDFDEAKRGGFNESIHPHLHYEPTAPDAPAEKATHQNNDISQSGGRFKRLTSKFAGGSKKGKRTASDSSSASSSSLSREQRRSDDVWPNPVPVSVSRRLGFFLAAHRRPEDVPQEGQLPSNVLL